MHFKECHIGFLCEAMQKAVDDRRENNYRCCVSSDTALCYVVHTFCATQFRIQRTHIHTQQNSHDMLAFIRTKFYEIEQWTMGHNFGNW